jgi:hypothetical protein
MHTAAARASAHQQLFAAAADFFLAMYMDGERNATFSHLPHDLVQSVCALHKHEAFVLSQVLQPHHSKNLDVA